MKNVVDFKSFYSLNKFESYTGSNIINIDHSAGTSDPDMKSSDPDDIKKIIVPRILKDIFKNKKNSKKRKTINDKKSLY
jgi:hypothetical protein